MPLLSVRSLCVRPPGEGSWAGAQEWVSEVSHFQRGRRSPVTFDSPKEVSSPLGVCKGGRQPGETSQGGTWTPAAGGSRDTVTSENGNRDGFAAGTEFRSCSQSPGPAGCRRESCPLARGRDPPWRGPPWRQLRMPRTGQTSDQGPWGIASGVLNHSASSRKL